MADDLIHKVAKAVRRDRFERNGRTSSFDGRVLPTDNELADARAAIRTVASFLSAYPNVYYALMHTLDDWNDL